MIGRKPPKIIEEKVDPKGFDDFELRLGDMMRGERATMGKSLLDVQRELRIKASYIAAIENSDPEAFDTPGFIAGYVRSYARYLDMDPDRAFAVFCVESGFTVAHGMSADASVIKKSARDDRKNSGLGADIFAAPKTPFAPTGDSVWSRVEPGAVGSLLVLVALIGTIGFGGFSVLKEIQRVQVAPVDQTPIVLADLDPIDGVVRPSRDDVNSSAPQIMNEPRADALDRLYRPQALDVPVLVPRDAPIASIDPGTFGSFTAPNADSPILAGVSPAGVPQVVEGPTPALQLIAAYPSWVRVRAADGTVIFEATMNKGDTWTVPATEEPPTLLTGESGAIYFAMSDACYGPAGASGSVTKNLPLHRQALAELYEPVKIQDDSILIEMVADLAEFNPLKALPCVAK